MKKAKLARIQDLDNSITPAEVTEAVASLDGCDVDSVRIGEVRRRFRKTMNTSGYSVLSQVLGTLQQKARY